MTGAEIFALYGAPFVLVVGGALLALHSRWQAKRWHERDRAQEKEARDQGERMFRKDFKPLGRDDVIFGSEGIKAVVEPLKPQPFEGYATRILDSDK